MKKLIVNVTRERIDSAIKGDSSHCMIADAIRDEYPHLKRISVDLQSIRFTDGDKRYVFLTPPLCQEMLLDFDQGHAIEPWYFNLTRPAQITKTKGVERKRSSATIKPQAESDRGAPVVIGGPTPPIGPLHGEAVKRNHDDPEQLRPAAGARNARRTGRIRRFGLKSMGR